MTKQKHISFEEMLSDASNPVPRITAEEAAALLTSDSITDYDRKLIVNTVAELAATAHLFKDIRHKPKITIFGSARTKPSDPDYIQCKNFAELMVSLGYMIITGAGPGIMAAGHEGAGAENSIGVNIDLPFEQSVNPTIAQSKYLLTYRYFFGRKLTFVREADAVVLCPGGFGTMDEAYEVLTLLQTGRAMPVPLVLLEKKGGTYWEKWLQFVREGLLETDMISKEDLHLFRRFTDINDAADYIHNFYRRFHSMRYVGDKVVLRLNSAVPDSLLEDLRTEYADFLGDFGIQKSKALAEEADEPDLMHLPRLIVQANRKHPVEMYRLVRSLNREVMQSSTRRQDRPELQPEEGSPKKAGRFPRPKRQSDGERHNEGEAV